MENGRFGLNINGFYKVNENGYSLTEATFYNPDTGESFSKIVWDMDDDRVCWEAGEYRDLSINNKVARLWKRHNGVIQDGDKVMVVSGRKVPIGTVSYVREIKPIHDRYGRWVADYVYMENGMRTNIKNVVLVIETETVKISG